MLHIPQALKPVYLIIPLGGDVVFSKCYILNRTEHKVLIGECREGMAASCEFYQFIITYNRAIFFHSRRSKGGAWHQLGHSQVMVN